ncbi:MAG TPA: methyltransferase [Chloroflexota bacterium]|nr:methyltransferase [Chloroflexota bacterium]
MPPEAAQPGPRDAATRLDELIIGYQVTQALRVVAVLGIADLLRDGERHVDDLAKQSDSDPGALYRVLRALASVGVFHEAPGRRFALTELGECLRSDSAQPLAPWAAFVSSPPQWAAWGNLLHSVRTGENAFRHTHAMRVWEYRAQHPEAAASFNAAMVGGSRRAAQDVLKAYDFSRFDSVADVGGGHGALLAAILAAHPHLRGTLFDQAHVVAGAGETLRAAGVAERCEVVGGSFFESVPAGIDCYALKFVIHDWEDDESVAILRTVRRAMGAPGETPRGTLLLIERVIEPPNRGMRAKFSDLNMLVSPGGRERTLDEYAALLDTAGFRLTRVISADSEADVIEALPV